MSGVTIRPLTANDRAWADEQLRTSWGGTLMVTRRGVYDLGAAPGFVATIERERIAFATYRIAAGDCEFLSLNGPLTGRGVGRGAGTALIAAVVETARSAGCRRLWLITTNDNTRALRFYQRRGFRLAARLLKPSPPLLGDDDIPIRDELELEQSIYSL